MTGTFSPEPGWAIHLFGPLVVFAGWQGWLVGLLALFGAISVLGHAAGLVGSLLDRVPWLKLTWGDMSHHDRKMWASVSRLDQLGDMVVSFLNGDLQQSPGHGGPPDPETTALIPALTVINRAGFITDNSQCADTDGQDAVWNTWVSGFATDAILASLRDAIEGTPLRLVACRGKDHECGRMRHLLLRCPWSECVGFWADRCPKIARDLYRCWDVTIEDPEPGRNHLLWGTLAAWAGEPDTDLPMDVEASPAAREVAK